MLLFLIQTKNFVYLCVCILLEGQELAQTFGGVLRIAHCLCPLDQHKHPFWVCPDALSPQIGGLCKADHPQCGGFMQSPEDLGRREGAGRGTIPVPCLTAELGHLSPSSPALGLGFTLLAPALALLGLQLAAVRVWAPQPLESH